jgi:hypothetical protein
MKPLRSWLVTAVAVAAAAGSTAVIATVAGTAAKSRHDVAAHLAASYKSAHMAIDCAYSSAMCTEVANSAHVFGYYVGHDEPSALFYSNRPGSGNHMRYDLTLPKDPSPSYPNAAGKSYAFELSGAEWLGMAMCDSQSFPEQVRTCPPDSNRNILSPEVSPKHVGEAYMEMQFYPPGWVPWPTWAVAVGASGCNPTEWCAALNIDSLSLNPVTNKANNPTCEAKVGEEYVNFAFITKNGKSQAPANPVDSTLATFTPSSKDLYMNSGDRLQVSFTDTKEGLRVMIHDLTTGQHGSMTASADNGFAQIKYDPNGTTCKAIPYNFHPMYSTSSPQTRVTWAAGSYNVAFDTEIGHFQSCNGPVRIPATPFGLNAKGRPTVCPKVDHEGRAASAGLSDEDDIFCFPASEALLYKVSGCSFDNVPGWDGASYQKLWPDGNTRLHPTPFQFTSPETGRNYAVQYSRAAFETDLPSNELQCDVVTGKGCTRIPITDENKPAAFYPFYTTTRTSQGCEWQFGNNVPGESRNFGQVAEYGKLLKLSYTDKGGGASRFYEDYRKILPANPCLAGDG